jgi:hypothetical protein
LLKKKISGALQRNRLGLGNIQQNLPLRRGGLKNDQLVQANLQEKPTGTGKHKEEAFAEEEN